MTDRPPVQPRPFTPERLADRWECSPAHVRRLCQRGDLPHFRIGKEYRIPQHVVEGIEQCGGRGSSSAERHLATFIAANTAPRETIAEIMTAYLADREGRPSHSRSVDAWKRQGSLVQSQSRPPIFSVTCIPKTRGFRQAFRGGSPNEMTDEEIAAPGRLTFPNGHAIDVDSLYKGQVCYRVHPADGGDSRWLRVDIAEFCELVRKENGQRPAATAPLGGGVTHYG